MNSDLLRQRRNLILISCGLLVFDFAKVTVAKISILGTELLIGDVRVVVYFAWTMWGYFLLRYYQYLRAEGDLGIWTGLRGYFEGVARTYVFREIKRQSLQGNITVKREGLGWRYFVEEYDPSSDTPHEIRNGKLPLGRVVWWMGKSVYYIAVNTPKVTDHILPFGLAVAVPIINLLKLMQVRG